MKNLIEEPNTLYGESQSKIKTPWGKKIVVICFVVVLLFAIRFLNLGLWWNVMRLELIHNPLTKNRVGDYSFLGFSGYEAARKRLMNELTLQKVREVTVISYYDLFHPAIFLIHSRSSQPSVDIGPIIVYPQKGYTNLLFHSSEILETRREKTGSHATYFGSSLLQFLYERFAGFMSNGKKRGISFIIKPIEEAKYLTIPYYFYFYLSLLAILIFIARFGTTFYISFFYYMGLFLLFDFKQVLFARPFHWLINILGVNISPTLEIIIATGIVTLFLIMGFIGIYSIRNRRMEPLGYHLTVWGKGLIFFFLLLPLFLRL